MIFFITSLVAEVPGHRSEVRLTRTELDEVMRQPLADFAGVLQDTLERNGVRELVAIASVGGGARIPIITTVYVWFNRPLKKLRPFPLPNVGVIAVAEHPSPFEDRIQRSRLFVGLCVWGRGQLEREIGSGSWQLTHARADDIFSRQPEALWSELVTSG